MTTIAGEGTPEATWQTWPALRRFPPLELAGCDRVVMVAPHPDDEILGAGGLLRLLAGRGATVDVVAVTDGDASHPDSPTVTPVELAPRRQAESTRALAQLGLDDVGLHRLGLGDGRVAATESRLADRLAGVLGDADDSVWCLSTWDGDGHPDHEATGRAAGAACAATGARLLSFPIWTWHWAQPDDPRVPWSRARSVALDPTAHAAKLAAVDCFDSQLHALSDHPADAAILGPAALARLTRAFEVVFT